MKRLARIIIGFVFFLFLAVLLIPVFFKDKIQEIIIQEFEKATEATIYFDIDQFSLSMIKNFPDFTVGLSEFGIVGKGIFEGDTLVHVGDLEARINLSDVLFGDQVSVKAVDLEDPRFVIMVLENGAANYDIAKTPDEEIVSPDVESESIDFGIQRFSISNGDFIYYDQASGVITELFGINVKGRGDFAADVFDLKTTGSIDELGLLYDGTEYVANKSLSMDVTLSMDLPNSTYAFKENEFVINQFPLAIDGEFGMLDEGYDLDLSFSSPSTDFKELFSLIPGAYTESFDEIQSSGRLGFAGNIKGVYSEESMPSFNLIANVQDGMIQYPDLPESITDVQMDLKVDNTSGKIEETLIDLNRLHINFGDNPFDAKLKLLNLKDYPIESDIKGRLNLSDLNKMLPMDGLTLSGMLDIDVAANGKYDSLRNIIPRLDVELSLQNGMIRYDDLPSPIENLQVNAEVSNSTGRMSDTKIFVENLSLSLDNQPFQVTGEIEDPMNAKWDIVGEGDLDLEKLMAFYPMEGVTVKGKINVNLKSSGSMADVEAKRFRRLPTSGTLELRDFAYEDESMTQRFEISEAETQFSTRAIEVNKFVGKAGQMDYEFTGSLSNYLGFVLNDEVLKGNLDLQADELDVNEWMTSEETTSDDGEDIPYEVVRIPRNIDFILDSRIDRVIYNEMDMTNISGKFIVKDGILDLNRAKFSALNGTVTMNGKYDSRPVKPSFDFGFDVSNVSIPSAFQSVSMIQKMAPVTENMTGDFNTDFAIKGLLNEDMMPDYSSITGKGIIQVLQASLGQSGVLSELSTVSKVANIGTATLERVNMTAEIREGRLYVKPFNLKLGDYTTEIAGSTGIDGTIDYKLAMDVPAGQVGTQLNGLIASLTNNSSFTGSDLKLDLSLKGTFSEPQVGLAGVRSSNGSSLGSSVTASVKTQVEDKKDEIEEEVSEKVEDAKDSARAVVDAKVEEAKDTLTSTINAQLDSTATKLTDKLGIPKDSLSKDLQDTKKKAEDLIKGLFKKKKKKTKKGKSGTN